MQNQKRYLVIVYFFCICLVLLGCQTQTKNNSAGSSDQAGPVLLQLKARDSEIQKQEFFGSTRFFTYEEGELRHERHQQVRFTTLTQSVQKDPLKITEITVEKDGIVSLHTYGWPELGEKWVRTYQPNGRVIEVEGAEPGSFASVSSLIFPDQPVRVGDEWTDRQEWATDSSRYAVEGRFRLRELRTCFKNETCAHIEVTARVIPLKTEKGMKLTSDHHGEILFAVERGIPVWTSFGAEEVVEQNKARQKIYSCVESALVEPKDHRWADAKQIECDPQDRKTYTIPGL